MSKFDPPSNINQETLDELLFDVLEMPCEARSNWLAERCGGNQTVIDEVLSLAQAHESLGDFLEDSHASGIKPRVHNDYTGQRLGAWRLDSVIGQGGMGRVYKARRDDGNYVQTVAVKVSPSMGVQSELFARERQVLADLNHPVISKILDAGDIPESPDSYLVMEFIDGINLVDFVDQNPELDVVERAQLVASLLEALHQAHRQGVLHCDIKPDNILVDKTGAIKLLDFGISRFVDPEPCDDNVINAITPAYASPQRLNGAAPTVSDDIYGVGLLFGLIMPETGKRISRNAGKVNELVPELARRLPPELKSIFLRAAASSPEHRYASAHAFLQDIQNWIAHRPVLAHQGGAPYRLKKVFKRHRFLSTAAVLSVVVLGTSAFAWQTHSEKLQYQKTQQTQVETAMRLSKSITEDLDLKISELSGSLPVRIATAEAAISQIEDFYRQQPENLDIRKALVKSLLHLQTFYFQPSQMHLGEFQKGRRVLRDAYELAYEVYNQENSVKNLMVLVQATRRITENTMIIDEDWNGTVAFERELLNEFDSYEDADRLSQASHRAQLYVMFRVHMLNGDTEKAKSMLDRAIALSDLPKDELSAFDKDKLSKTGNRLLELRAVYFLMNGDLDVAKTQFEHIVENHVDQARWRDKRRALYAYRALGCIALQQNEPNYSEAFAALSSARSVAESLSSTYPNAVNLRWEVTDLSAVNEFGTAVELQGEQNGVWSDHQRWFNAFACDNPGYLHMPAPPPGGWSELRSDDEIDLLSLLKPLRHTL